MLNKLILIALLSVGLFSCAVIPPNSSPASRVLAPLEVQITVASESLPTQAQIQAEKALVEVQKLCKEVGDKLGSVSVQGCLSHQLVHSGEQSSDGRALVYKDYAQENLDLAKVLVVGGIHGDEYSSFSLLFRWMERLDSYKDYANVEFPTI